MLRPRHQPSSCRDRTREFRDACGGGGLGPAPLVSEFRRRAAGVGHGISEASRKISHLAQLAKSTSALMTLLRVYKIWLLQSTRM
ncbi:hypothetical protein PVAP13_3KG159354 [Panicum virgatum]|uniref:Syntaxin-5 N-terminal Sly1p-binding domain-containing protein n=1 Tax=Panicum virgatum TaxID=38727 RepID=A0A8T0UQL1_PANVG|nr:hypothetical protein PVAP13_3KG159354 [Panicum virgatum]